MTKNRLAMLLSLVVLALSPRVALAQSDAADPAADADAQPMLRGAPHHFWASASSLIRLASPASHPDMRAAFLGWGRSYPFHGTDGLTVRWSPDWLLLGAVSEVVTEVWMESCTPSDPKCTALAFQRGTALGIGTAPAALTLSAPVHDRLAVSLRGSGGMIWSTHRIPHPLGSRMNFVASAAGLVHVRLSPGAVVGVGVQQLHLSNGGRKRSNPGLDARGLRLEVEIR